MRSHPTMNQASIDFRLGSELVTALVPRENVYVVPRGTPVGEQDGKPIVVRPDGSTETVPDGVEVVSDADLNASPELYLDVVTLLRIQYVKGSVVLAGNKLPCASIAVKEIDRRPLSEVKQTAEALFSSKDASSRE